MSTKAVSAGIVLDCADPVALAEFYRVLTGWKLTGTGDSAALDDGGSVRLGFQRVAGYRAADWPADSARTHLDFTVPDVERAVQELLELGATKPQFQPGKDEWTVLADPEGHVFCLMASE
ncbi:hypothetical protein SUDANB121_05770 [Nocardiopsis dassonvillei]|uniref:VOC family protein n=1 Tax=Nocardiopsis dassonvillei TaxID=2014 RepID=UPI003F56D720